MCPGGVPAGVQVGGPSTSGSAEERRRPSPTTGPPHLPGAQAQDRYLLHASDHLCSCRAAPRDATVMGARIRWRHRGGHFDWPAAPMVDTLIGWRRGRLARSARGQWTRPHGRRPKVGRWGEDVRTRRVGFAVQEGGGSAPRLLAARRRRTSSGAEKCRAAGRGPRGSQGLLGRAIPRAAGRGQGLRPCVHRSEHLGRG